MRFRSWAFWQIFTAHDGTRFLMVPRRLNHLSRDELRKKISAKANGR